MKFIAALLSIPLLFASTHEGEAERPKENATPILAAPDAAPTDSRLVVIGFDGGDSRITKKLMADKQLPNFQKLDETGSFHPLLTTNPAQSPVSWAAFNTGMGPDTTNIYDFVCRENVDRATNEKLERPRPANAMAFKTEASADDYLPMPLRSGMRIPLTAGAAAGIFLIFFLLFRFGAKFPKAAAILLSLILGLTAGGATFAMTRYLPRRVPVAKAERRGTPFWKYLDEHGVKSVGLSIPMVFPLPPENLPHTKILAGLGVPDARQTNGDWFVFTSDPTRIADLESKGQMGGSYIKLQLDEQHSRERSKIYTAVIEGPENFWLTAALRDELKEISTELSKGPGPDRIRALGKRQDEINRQLDNPRATLQFNAKIGDDGKKVSIELDHKIISRTDGGEFSAGDWSPITRAVFQFNPLLKLSVLIRFQITSVNPLEIFLKPLNLDPKSPPPTAPISQPVSFSAELASAAGVGDFETLGWACMTNPLKDLAIDETTFLTDIENVLAQRKKLLFDQLARKDWRLLYMVFGETDRVAHLMMRYYDDQHPLYKKDEASKPVTFFGKQMTLSDTIPEIYRQADAIVGEVLKRIEDGRSHLMVVSDHGFASFRQQVHLNNWLAENGYMTFKTLTDDEKRDITENRMSLKDFNDPKKVFKYLDFSKTKAYSLGLGKIYINVKGREKQGIVEPADQEAVEREIAQKLEAAIDPNTQKPFVKRAYLAREIYPDRGKGLKPGERDNSEDIILGFHEGYRVSWDSTLGGTLFNLNDRMELVPKPFIEPNLEKWSGDHCSVDPSVVTGIFFSTARFNLPPDTRVPDVRHCAPTILQYFGVPVPPGQRAPMTIAK